MARDFTLSTHDDRVVSSIVEIEACESFRKQTYRNRCMICSDSGPMQLSVPIVHEPRHNIPIRKVRIDWSTPWLIRTFRALDSAYHTSAFFDHYRDDLYNIMERHHEYLFDLNLDLTRFLLEKTHISCDIRLTGDFVLPGSIPDDYRYTIDPKHPDTILRDLGLDSPYYQVFSSRHGFLQDLSVVDLLFNEGPEALLYLKRL